ncbi:MAG: hypothetical protein ACE5MI_00245 [Acidimicrobiia bacterium]
MRFSVEPWDPDYGTPTDMWSEEPSGPVDVDIEIPGEKWTPQSPTGEPAEHVLFIDGVRRVDANLWITEGETAVMGVCASYAAGAVLCNGTADIVAAEVRRGLFTPAGDARALVTSRATYELHATAGSTPEELWLGVQQRMGDLERDLPASEGQLVVVDGPLRGRAGPRGAVGYIKTHRVNYLPPALQPVLGNLLPGQRTPVFLTTTSWSRYSWYLRLPGSDASPMSGIVRCEAPAELEPSEATATADLVSATLPRFASGRHKEPRAPQNLYPVGGLERHLRRRLGDRDLLYRALRRAAWEAA